MKSGSPEPEAKGTTGERDKQQTRGQREWPDAGGAEWGGAGL